MSHPYDHVRALDAKERLVKVPELRLVLPLVLGHPEALSDEAGVVLEGLADALEGRLDAGVGDHALADRVPTLSDEVHDAWNELM